MPERQSVNLQVVEKVALALDELNKEVVYVGGAVVALYATEEGGDPPRPTKDIDIAVQISTYSQMDELREKLAAKKIYPAPSEKIICRYVYEDILIDFIPFEETALGPTNSWLKPGFKKAYPRQIGKTEVNLLPVSLFLASKWEAYKKRGNDPRASHDFEEIIYLLDNNLEVAKDIKNAEKNVMQFLKEMSGEILSHSSRNEIIECHLNPLTAEERREVVIERLQEIHEL